MGIWKTLQVLLIAAAVLAGTPVFAQSAHLKVQEQASRTGVRNMGSPDSQDAALRSFDRSQTLKVTLTSMQTGPGDFVVHWCFLAKDIATKEIHAYDRGEKTVTLKGGAFTDFEVKSKALPEDQVISYVTDDNDDFVIPTHSEAGAKPAGYVFTVKAGDKVVDIVASDRDVKDEYLKRIAARNAKLAEEKKKGE